MSSAKAGSASGLYLSGALSSGPSASPARRAAPSNTSNGPSPMKRRKPHHHHPAPKQRSIWNTADDWDELVATSTLSTSSISTRRPRPRGVHTLVKSAGDAAARGFKVLWEDNSLAATSSSAVGDEVASGVSLGSLAGRGWLWDWEEVPVHLKRDVRDGVFRWWGGVITLNMLKHFSVAPELYLPGTLLSCLSETTTLPLSTLIPNTTSTSSTTPARAFTTLKLQHAQKLSDRSIALLIQELPNLEVINLKGCLLAGKKTVQAIIKSCPKMRRINLKGTSVDQEDLRDILDTFGHQLEGLKVDQVQFLESPDSIFASAPFPHLTHLCLPGDLINLADRTLRIRAKARNISHALPPPTARAAPPNATFNWDKFDTIFPALTHLYLPNLLIPPSTDINLSPQSLIKLSLGAGGVPVPIGPITQLVKEHNSTLRFISLGHLLPSNQGSKAMYTSFQDLADALSSCRWIEEFRLEADPKGSNDIRSDSAMKSASLICAETVAKWRGTLKKLTLRVPAALSVEDWIPDESEVVAPLEHLDVGGTMIKDTAEFARVVSGFPNLRSLDLSATSITEEDVFTILDSCPLVSRIDLTSCRGIPAKHRRSIFAVSAVSDTILGGLADEFRHGKSPDELPKRTRLVDLAINVDDADEGYYLHLANPHDSG